MPSRIHFITATFLFASAIPYLRAQTSAAQITGIISDPSGAAIAGASITAANVATGVRRETASNPSGNYAVPLLDPGTYSLIIQKPGFQTVDQSGIQLNVDQIARLDFKLSVGAASDKVTVTAEAPLLNSAQSSLSGVVDNRKVTDLPLNGRNPFDLVFLVPGAQAYGRPNLPGNNIPLSNLSINGGPALTNEVTLDGIPNTSPQFNQYAIIPSIDAVQEFKVETSNMPAEFGRTGGGVVNVTMRSGTNQFHGTLYDFLRNSAFDASNWFNNANGQASAPLRLNQFGASIGGPIRRDKTFFFFNYEGIRRSRGETNLFTVPRQDQRRGDFSRTFAQNGQVIQIYDPATSRQLPDGSWLRDPFPGNIVPPNRIDPVSAKLLSYWPLPNLPGNPITGINNFINNASEAYDVDQTNTRIDHAFSEKNRIFGRFSSNTSNVIPPNVFRNIANPASGPQLFRQENVALNDTHVFSATNLATFRAGFARLRDSGHPIGLNSDPSQAGFPAYLTQGEAVPVLPQITVDGYNVSNIGFGTSGLGPVASALLNNISNVYTLQSDLTHVQGRHVLKVGADARLFRLDGSRPQAPSFNFTSGITQGPNPAAASANTGQPFASYLLGAAASGNAQAKPTQDTQSYYLGLFVQDDFKVTSRLNLNLGLRWEQESLRTDRYNRLTTLDLTSPLPLQVPGLPRLRGGSRFAGVNGNPRQQADLIHSLDPRVGFAWQALSRTVIRGCYGIYELPRTGVDFGNFGQIGFSSTTPYVGTLNGFTPITTISNPFPNGFVPITGNTQGLLTNIGGTIASIDPHQQAPYVQQWNFDVQQSFFSSWLIDVAYAGSKGTHLPENLQLNQLPDRYLALGNALLTPVANPFFGVIPASQPLGARTVQAGQLLRPYPQFTGVSTINSTAGSSTYHSLQVKLEKRYSAGLTLLISYTLAKLIDSGTTARFAFLENAPPYQDNNNLRLERSLSPQDRSQHLALAAGYELPFGRGKGILGSASPLVSRIVGGWQLNLAGTVETGNPLALTTSVNNTSSFGGGSRPNSSGRRASLSGPVQVRLNRYFDTSAFAQPPPFTFGTVARSLPDVRGPGLVDFDLSLFKNTKIYERATLQFRAEAFNALNHPNFGDPGTVYGLPTFGVVSSAGDARILQLALKLIF